MIFSSRSTSVAAAKAAASTRGKEPFEPARFREIYARVNADRIDKYTPWDTIVTESEYNYYVTFEDKMTMADFVAHMRYLDGWG